MLIKIRIVRFSIHQRGTHMCILIKFQSNSILFNYRNLFPFECREFPQYIQRKELKWIEISLAEEVFGGKCTFLSKQNLECIKFAVHPHNMCMDMPLGGGEAPI